MVQHLTRVAHKLQSINNIYKSEYPTILHHLQPKHHYMYVYGNQTWSSHLKITPIVQVLLIFQASPCTPCTSMCTYSHKYTADEHTQCWPIIPQMYVNLHDAHTHKHTSSGQSWSLSHGLTPQTYTSTTCTGILTKWSGRVSSWLTSTTCTHPTSSNLT